MSYTGFAGYACHPTQLSTQLSLMTSNSNNSSADSPVCCSSSGVTDSRTNAQNVTNNTNMNLSANQENHIQSAMHSTQSLTSSPQVCALTTPYESRIISSYPRLGGLYGPSYTEQNSFYTSSTNPFYASFGSPYDMKESSTNGWAPLPQTTCYPYDPTIYSPYGERYSAMDSATRRKNATRETTNTLKAWLYEHRKNPYPTKGEKIMLAIITKMTLTQVSTWFANARRRLKKENKMTWEPRNKSSDGHDSDDKESFRDTDDNSSNIADNPCLNANAKLSIKKESDSAVDKSTASLKGLSSQPESDSTNSYPTVKESIAEKSHSEHIPNGHESKPIVSHQINNNSRAHLNSSHLHVKQDSAQNMLDGVTSIETIGQRPKIWSLAQTATSESPPYSGKVCPITPTDWAPALPAGPEGAVGLSDYQKDSPQGSRFASTNFRKYGQTWTEEHCARSAAMHLFSSDTIASHNYFNSHPSKSVTGGSFTGNGHHSHLQLSAPVSHLMASNAETLNNSYNGIRPIVDSQSCHSLADLNDNRLTNGSVSKSNTFLCKVFPEYISSGPDALSFNDNASDRGSALSVEDSSLSSSSSPNLDSNNSNMRHINGTNPLGFSAFRPTLKR